MDDNLTPRAQATLKAAALARARGHSYVGAEHLLLAVINSGSSVASAALARCDVDIDD